VRLLGETLRETLQHAGRSLADVKLVVLHQANLRILEAAASELGIRQEQLLINLDRLGNTSAGSIPLGLDEAWRAGQIERGDLVLVCGFGAGLAWGTALIRW
jgi:3-oxoacyl-[acyl-carrier-protein] synthase-3